MKRQEKFVSPSFVESVIKGSYARCTIAKAMGGVALEEVEERGLPVPQGWTLDVDTKYYLPTPIAHFWHLAQSVPDPRSDAS